MELTWQGVVGPLPLAMPAGVIINAHDNARQLDASYTVGPLTLTSSRTQLIEHLRAEPQSLTGVTTVASCPIIVQSTTTGHDHADAERTAVGHLHRLACLLALCWAEPWQVRSAPCEASRNLDPIGEAWPWPGTPGGGDDSSWPPPPDPQPLPSWLSPAWDELGDTKLSRALSCWHEGILMEASHQSFAYAAYTATIEAIVQTAWGRETIETEGVTRCKACGATRGSGARFRAAVELVATDAELSALDSTGRGYGHRSRTLHQGQTHGIETIFGAMFTWRTEVVDGQMRMIPDDGDAEVFVLRTVPALRRVARRLLLHALDGASAA